MARGSLRRLALLLSHGATLCLGAMPTVASRDHAAECPCINPQSRLYGQAATLLKDVGLEGYGLSGCAAYDKGISWQVGPAVVTCKAAHPSDTDLSYCFTDWCFVDEDLCQVNRTLCDRPGSSSSVHCRERPRAHTNIPGLGLYYSYQTCGSLDSYGSISSSFPEMTKRRVLKVSPMSSPPLSFFERNIWTGSLYEFFNSSAMLFPNMSVEFADPPISEDSIKKINGSSWTACVHDVGIGRIDACIGDFWVTDERMQIANFLPSVYEEAEYFLIKPKETNTLEEMLARPFRPFTPELWLFIVGFLLLAGLMLVCAERHHNVDDFPPHEPTAWHCARTLYYALTAFAAGPVHVPTTRAGKLITLGLSFFVLISVSSYTANLASFLLAESLQNEVRSFEDALEAKYRICIHGSLATRLERMYPRLVTYDLLFRPTYDRDCPGFLQRGKVDGIILSAKAIDRMYAGDSVLRDCGTEKAPGKFAHDKVSCPKAGNGDFDLSRDCGITRVGDAPLHVSVSFPVTAKLQHALAWASTRQIAGGKLKAYQDEFVHRSWSAKTQCTTASQAALAKSKSLPITAMAGTILISTVLVLGGAFGACFGHYERFIERKIERNLSQNAKHALGLDHHEGEEEDHDNESESAGKELPETRSAPEGVSSPRKDPGDVQISRVWVFVEECVIVRQLV